jgi:chemosensory pili system protein ChpC
VSEAQSIIPSLYLPVGNTQLLLPNVSVAEVVGYQAPANTGSKQNYFLGMFPWRGINIPLISYEVANGQVVSPITPNSRVAVINTIGAHQSDLPFIAIVTQGIPRLVKVSSDLNKHSEGNLGKADAAMIKLDGEEAIIPNIEYLESLAFDNL